MCVCVYKILFKSKQSYKLQLKPMLNATFPLKPEIGNKAKTQGLRDTKCTVRTQRTTKGWSQIASLRITSR